MTKYPFSSANFEATPEQIKKANEAYNIAAKSFFNGVDIDDTKKMQQLEKLLQDAIGNYFNDDFTSAEIAFWATGK